MRVKEQSIITSTDEQRLRQTIASTGNSLPMLGDPLHSYLRALANQLTKSSVVSVKDIRPEVVTMNSRIRVHELDSGRRRTVTLVYPNDGEPCGEKISVLTPLGASLLGAAVGDVVEWSARRAPRRIRVEKILFQPEAAGKFDL